MLAKPLAKQLNVPCRYVVAVNESDASMFALELAARLAKPCDSICVFHVIDTYKALTTEEEKLYLNAYERDCMKKKSQSSSLSALTHYEVVFRKDFVRAVALQRAEYIVNRYKAFGFNVLVLDDEDENTLALDDDVHPILHLADKIACAAAELSPSFLVMGSGNYSSGTLAKYYNINLEKALPQSAYKVQIQSKEFHGVPSDIALEEAIRVSAEENDRNDSNNVLLTITECVADHHISNYSIIAAKIK